MALLVCQRDAQAQRANLSQSQTLITNARVDIKADSFQGPVYVTVNGKEMKIADEALAAWLINGGRQVVYSGRDGAGGFENEGQSLRVYDAQSGKTKKVLSEYVGVDKVTDVKTSGGKIALLVEMVDGGLGASYLAVVDPLRGEVFYRRWVKILSRNGDIVKIGHYAEDYWPEMDENQNAKVRPRKIEKFNLSAVLKNRIIVNKRDRP